jgi:uncharacterized SAM-binding protein YcdF (DUF218 family)
VIVRLSRRIRASIIGLALALVLALAIGFAWFVAHVPTTEPAIAGRADGIVVLTGGASRINDAVELLATGHGQRLLITGVHPSVTEKGIARNVPEHKRIFDCCVDLDRSALNTFGNATETRRWALEHHFHSLIVVTSAYHMPRAMAEIGHALPEVSLTPFPVVTDKMREGEWWSSASTTRLLLSEYFKYVLATVRMRLAPNADAPTASRVSDILHPRAR